MEKFDFAQLENRAYAITVNLFSLLKLAKEQGAEIAEGQEMIDRASKISSFVLDIEGNSCKYIEKLKEIIAHTEKLGNWLDQLDVGNKLSDEKNNLLIDVNLVAKQLKLLLG